MIYQKKFTLLQNSVYLLSFDTSYKMYFHALRYHHVFGINERRENALDNEEYSLIKNCVAIKISH